MSAVWMVVRCEMRRRWQGMVVLTLLVAVVGSVVLATLAGARRTDTAPARFSDWSREASATVSFGIPTPAQLRALGRVPNVSAFAVARGLMIQFPAAPNLALTAAVDTKFGTAVDRARIIAGRAENPSTADEITIGESMAAQLHLGVGSHLDSVSYTPEQAKRFFSGAADPSEAPAGPRVRFRIVGIVRRPLDLGRSGALGGTVVLTPAFYRAYAARLGAWGSIARVQTRNGAADLPRLQAETARIFGRSPPFGVQNALADSGGTQNAVDVLVVALWIFAGVAALAGVVTIGIVLNREIALASLDPLTARALGLTRAQRVAITGLRGLLIAGGGALLAAVGAVAASPIFPIGVARRAEPDPGLRVDWAVLALGCAAAVAVVGLIAIVAAFRSPRQSSLRGAASARRKRSTVPELAARAGFAPSVTNGLRMALQPGQGRTAVPVRSAFLGAIFGVLGVTAVLGYTSSLGHLVTTPRLYGWTWDFAAKDIVASGTSCSRDAFGLLEEPGVGAVAGVCYGNQNIELDGHSTNGWGFTSLRGTIDPEIVAGRAPSGPREVALGGSTMRTLRKNIGDTVRGSGHDGKLDYRIVGRVVLPTMVGETQPVAEGAVFTGDGFAPFFDPNNFQNDFTRAVIGRFAPGADRVAVERRIAAVPQLDAPNGPSVPIEIDRLRQVNWLPAMLAVLLSSLALVAVGHALVTAVGRRRRDLAVLTTFGCTRRQVRATVAWQATTQATVGLVFGIPTGIVVGDLVWRAVADGIGVSPNPKIPTLALLLTVVCVLVLVNFIAAFPAQAAANTRPAAALRSE